MSDSGTLLPILAAHLALTALPGVAATLCAARRGLRRVPVLLAVGLAGSGAVAILSFWAYYASPEVGETFVWFALLGSVLLAGWSLYGGCFEPGLLRALATPLALWALGSTFLLFLGFLHGGTEFPLATASTRFSSPMPTDNQIPFFFGEWLFHHGHRSAPIFPPDWLSSDRPPLEVGYLLSQRTFGWGNPELHYQVLGVVLQQLWIVGLWALLVAARVGRVTRGLAMLTMLLSDLAIVNGFFVWPKLLPAAMLLAAAALVLTPLWDELRRGPRAGVLVGALLGLAMLGHGSSVFAVAALALVAAFRGLPSGRWLATALLAGVVLMVPWFAYQRLADPPGNRLTKWMLGGATEVDDRSTSEAIVDGYREAGFGGAVHNKAENFVTMAGGGPALGFAERAASAAGHGELDVALRETRAILFFYLLPSLGLLLLALPAMALARNRVRGSPGGWRFALVCLAVVAVACVFWGLLIFGSEQVRTVIHAGSYLVPILALTGAAVGLRAVLPRFGAAYLCASAALMLALYVPSLEPPLPGTAFSPTAALLAAAALGGFVAVGFRRPRSGAEIVAEPAAAS
jgi:hypothetical protein